MSYTGISGLNSAMSAGLHFVSARFISGPCLASREAVCMPWLWASSSSKPRIADEVFLTQHRLTSFSASLLHV